MPLEITIGPPLLTINNGHTVLASEPDGQIHPNSDKGLYFFDTRLISNYQFFSNGTGFTLLNAAAIYHYASRAFLINEAFETEDGCVPARSVGLVLNRTVQDGLHEDYELTNYGSAPVRFNFEIMIRCDFADLFDVKAHHLVRRGRITSSWDEQSSVLTCCYSNAGFRRGLKTSVYRADSRGLYTNGRLSFDVQLEAGRTWRTCLLHDLIDGDRTFEAPRDCFAHAPSPKLGGPYDEWKKAVLKLETSNEEFYRLYQQAIDDMAALRLPVEGTDHLRFIPAAGVPWFVSLFGRDSLIAALQTVLVYPDFARGALEVLGEHQAKEVDDYRDAEPGKILHELRHGELARLGKVPHAPYYGTADATPLYVILLHVAWRCTGDRALLDQHLGTAERCLEWIDRYGDRDGDGFQEYATRSPEGLENQGWKDAGDAVVNVDGTLVEAPKALCELQGYVYDAWLRMAEIYDTLGRDADARRLRGKATELYRRFDEAFWDEEGGFYAYCLDAEKRKVLTVASNPGHLLWSGIVPPDKAARVVERLMRRDMWSGWGIRTLSADHPSFNPFSYQNGSVWPHDNGLIAFGFKRYGFHEEAARVARDISEAGSFFMLHQMPELYAGIERDGSNFPVQYAGANVPQAWAAGSVFFLLQAIVGFQAQGQDGLLYLDPWMPTWLPDLTLRDLRVGQHTFALRLVGAGADVSIEVLKGDPDRVRRRPIVEAMDALRNGPARK